MKNFNKLVKTLAVSTLSLGIVTASMSEAKATSLVPTQEGQIQLTNLNCLPGIPCIDTETELGYTVESLEYNDNFGLSRLFADDRDTPNDYGLGINFLAEDEGTNPELEQVWLRPVAYKKNGQTFENGRLEVGSFLFDFLGETLDRVEINFFDVEDAGVTGVIELNGETVNIPDLLEAGPDGNTQTLVLENVQNFKIQLGNVENSQFSTGDGVAINIASVPESETTIGLGVLGVAGMLTLKRRKRASQKA